MIHAKKTQTGLLSKKRRKYSPEFKFKLALEAIKRDNLTELSREYSIGTNTLSEWRTELIKNGSNVFETTPNKENSKLKKVITRLEQMLGRKEIELNLLKNFSDFYKSQD